MHYSEELLHHYFLHYFKLPLAISPSRLQEMVEEKEKDSGGTEKKALVRVSATSKQQWKEHLGLKMRKHRREEEEEEEYCEVDDEKKDPDYQPEQARSCWIKVECE